MYDRIVAFGFLLFTLLGIAFIGHGITGMVVLDDTVRPLCENDAECQGEDVCCFFHEKQAGVCHLPERCGIVVEMTKQKAPSANAGGMNVGKDRSIDNLFTGILVLVFVGITFYFYRQKPIAATARLPR